MSSGLWGLLGVIIGSLLTFLLTEWHNFKITKNKLKSHWQALKEEAEICKIKADEFINDSITAPLYRLPTMLYQTSFPFILANDKLSKEETSSVILYFTQVDHFNRGLDIAEKKHLKRELTRNASEALFGRTKVQEINNRNKLYATELSKTHLYLNLKRIFENKLKTK